MNKEPVRNLFLYVEQAHSRMEKDSMVYDCQFANKETGEFFQQSLKFVAKEVKN